MTKKHELYLQPDRHSLSSLPLGKALLLDDTQCPSELLKCVVGEQLCEDVSKHMVSGAKVEFNLGRCACSQMK